MTYDVPYAFVPGTKAKADEVNANFNDIIQKLQDTNGSVEEQFSAVNNQIGTMKNQISQLNSGLSAANSNISNKANASDIDGKWVKKNYTIFSEKTWTVSNNILTYNLSSYLPRDNNIYEVLFSSDGRTGATAGSTINCYVGSSYVDLYNVVYRCLTRTAYNVIGGGNCIVPIGTDRILNFKMNVTGSTSGNCYAYLLAYRKVR